MEAAELLKLVGDAPLLLDLERIRDIRRDLEILVVASVLGIDVGQDPLARDDLIGRRRLGGTVCCLGGTGFP